MTFLFDRIEADMAELRGLVTPPAAPVAEPMLEPCQLAYEIKRSESQARRLCRKAKKIGLPGVEQEGTRWRATVSTIRAAQAARA